MPPRVFRKLGLLASLSVLLAVLSTGPRATAAEFNFARYKETDLDEFLARRRPATGMDVYPMSPLKLDVTLASHGEPCANGALKRSLIMSGMPKQDADSLQATNCITVRSAKGRELKVFMQDVVYGFLPNEVPVGGKLSLYAIHAFTSPDGPGLLVSEFLTPRSFPRADKPADTTMTSCGCWTHDEHPGVDFTADKPGAPVAAMADGVIVKIEAGEQAPADFPGIGGCGRYVVLKHTYPNGGIVYTRYVQLGRVVGPKGETLRVGATVKAKDTIGEIGPSKVLHFELRPVAPGNTTTDKAWSERYGKMPDMEWSRYETVDPQKFDVASFGGVRKATK
ncbi:MULTISPECIES: M23 family metallopeptidase [unclassified Bradyrhizobium]|uniref:M23 family metallopeptidase n=1 Tax=unclassified Bradyrhizobium TaxID=2631580 RepID=UPI001CD5C5EF|nr:MULTISPECIES: M23 family metallopeptidase [unclassified Bradyrhizobium]MCA1380971.1 M23 family metallopeptidase [Bradyrhizobium sp. BRP05]MCA1418908.1 M23 family metallopeptidase [Bradyrhizobium sp. BRP23]MCA1546763.1 M23 family metallopeptidase [Bradyrhizobium sp. BRP19]